MNCKQELLKKLKALSEQGVGGECTKTQKIEIEFLFDFYKRVYEKDVKLFLKSFIQKHRIFGELKDGEKADAPDSETLRRMQILQSAMSDETPVRQIERC